jgi:hypothetical protein
MSVRTAKWMMLAVLGGGMAVPVMGQESGGAPPTAKAEDGRGEHGGDRQGPPRHEDGRGDRGGDRQGPPPRRMEGGMHGRPDGPPGAPGRPDAPRPPIGEAGSPQVRAMMGYLQLVDQYRQLTEDPTAAGVAAVVTAGDVLRPRGAQAAIEYFEKQLPQVKSVSVGNAIRLQLADFYRASGNADKALEHLSALMKTEVVGKGDSIPFKLEKPE